MNFHFRNMEVGTACGLIRQVSNDSTAIKILSKVSWKKYWEGKVPQITLVYIPTLMDCNGFVLCSIFSNFTKYLKQHKYQFYINSLSLLPLPDTSKFPSYSLQPNLVLHLLCKPTFTATYTTSISVLTKQSSFHARKTELSS